MIHFDTNALIALPEWSRMATHPVIERVLAGELAAACSVVWYEYAVGPVDDGELERAEGLLQGGIVAVTREDASLAAQLFNAAGRHRTLKTDALIAAAAIRAGAEFVTVNVADFEPFAAHGLRIVKATV
ncbi:MAG TPA: PIN domain-containing protein [Nevskiaceae bacterium]